MTDKEIVERAKEAEKRTGFGELVHSPVSKGVNSAYGIGFIEGMVEYRNSMQEEPVSKVWHDASEKSYKPESVIIINPNDYSGDVLINCVCVKEGRLWAYTSDLLNLSNVQSTVKNWKEPVSEDFEKIVEEIAEPTILNAYGTKELARRLRNTICGTSVSEDLGEYINELSKQFPEVSFAKLSRIAVRVAKWQKQQDQSTIELAEDHAMLAGMEKMKEQMMAKAIDVEVKVDAGGYPYIPQMELYDYDKDVSLAKKGDKYKVVLIKED